MSLSLHAQNALYETSAWHSVSIITLSLSGRIIHSDKYGQQRLIDQTVDSITVSHASWQVYLAPWPKVFLHHDATIWVAMATAHTSTHAHIVHRN